MPQPSKLQNLKLRYMQLLWTLPALSTAVRTAWWSDRIPSCDVCNYRVHYQLNKYHHKISLMKHERIKVEHPNTGSKKLLLESLIIGVRVTLQHPIQKLRLTMMMHHHSTFYWNWNWWQFRWLIMFGTKCTKKSLCYLLLYINIMYYASGLLFWYALTKNKNKKQLHENVLHTQCFTKPGEKIHCKALATCAFKHKTDGIYIQNTPHISTCYPWISLHHVNCTG